MFILAGGSFLQGYYKEPTNKYVPQQLQRQKFCQTTSTTKTTAKIPTQVHFVKDILKATSTRIQNDCVWLFQVHFLTISFSIIDLRSQQIQMEDLHPI